MGGAGRAGSVLVKLLSTAGTGYFYVKARVLRLRSAGLQTYPMCCLPSPLRLSPRPPVEALAVADAAGEQKKNPKKLPGKLEFMKYDPRVRQHVLFQETKLK